MKKGVGIVAEFNPFHKGHEYIIKKAKKETGADFAGVVLSGNFTQRGEGAVFDKFLRTRAALMGGADIVLELPVVYACAAADCFAFGGCDTLSKSGIFDYMAFGCECDEPKLLFKAAELLENESAAFKAAFREYTEKGMSYPKAREKALVASENFPKGILDRPNNILAVEYIKAANKIGSELVMTPIKRVGAEYDDSEISEISEDFSSAAAVRKALWEGRFEDVKKAVPDYLYELYAENYDKNLCDTERFKEALRYIIIKKGKEGLREICDITEGLENSIYENMGFESVEGLLKSLKSKRYTLAKLRRVLVHILLDIKKEEAYPPKTVPYIRVLGVKEEKKELLGEVKKRASVPVIINVKKDIEGLSEEGRRLMQKEIFASQIYNPKETAADFTKGIAAV